MVYLERARQYFRFVFARELLGVFECQVEPRFMEDAACVFLELQSKRRHNIEGCVKSRKLLQNFHHTPVVLQGMQARPRQHIPPRFRIAVLRLMHVPQHNQVDPVHRPHRPLARLGGVLHSANASCASWIGTSSAKFFVMRSLASSSSRLSFSFLNWSASWNSSCAIWVPGDNWQNSFFASFPAFWHLPFRCLFS